MVDTMTKSRAERATALENWADETDPTDLKLADTSTLRAIAELVDQRNGVDDDLASAVQIARESNKSWAEIGTMLGVSKQAAQQKYGPLSTTS